MTFREFIIEESVLDRMALKYPPYEWEVFESSMALRYFFYFEVDHQRHTGTIKFNRVSLRSNSFLITFQIDNSYDALRTYPKSVLARIFQTRLAILRDFPRDAVDKIDVYPSVVISEPVEGRLDMWLRIFSDAGYETEVRGPEGEETIYATPPSSW